MSHYRLVHHTSKVTTCIPSQFMRHAFLKYPIFSRKKNHFKSRQSLFGSHTIHPIRTVAPKPSRLTYTVPVKTIPRVDLVVIIMPLCASVNLCLVVTCWERADLLALVCDIKLCICHFPMWYPGSGMVLDCIDS